MIIIVTDKGRPSRATWRGLGTESCLGGMRPRRGLTRRGIGGGSWDNEEKSYDLRQIGRLGGGPRRKGAAARKSVISFKSGNTVRQVRSSLKTSTYARAQAKDQVDTQWAGGPPDPPLRYRESRRKSEAAL